MLPNHPDRPPRPERVAELLYRFRYAQDHAGDATHVRMSFCLRTYNVSELEYVVRKISRTCPVQESPKVQDERLVVVFRLC